MIQHPELHRAKIGFQLVFEIFEAFLALGSLKVFNVGPETQLIGFRLKRFNRHVN
jgi:hypothetical protein